MKTLYTILVLIFSLSQANATVHIITVSNNQFTPDTLNAVCGDTVKWIWDSGDHTTWSTSVPVGATQWFESINSIDTSFSYQVNLAGTYDYLCYFHTMMTGSIIVTCPTGLSYLNDNYFALVYPNPSDGDFTIDLGNNYESITIKLTDLNGKLIEPNYYNNTQLLHLKIEEPVGIYLIHIETESKKAVIKLIKE